MALDSDLYGKLMKQHASPLPSPTKLFRNPSSHRCTILKNILKGYLLVHSGHNRLSSRSGGAKVQAGNMKREVILLGVSGTQVWPAWNCRRTQPSVSAKSSLPWTTHHRTPEACGRKDSEAQRACEFTAFGWIALAAILDHAASMATWAEVTTSTMLVLSSFSLIFLFCTLPLLVTMLCFLEHECIRASRDDLGIYWTFSGKACSWSLR